MEGVKPTFAEKNPQSKDKKHRQTHNYDVEIHTSCEASALTTAPLLLTYSQNQDNQLIKMKRAIKEVPLTNLS